MIETSRRSFITGLVSFVAAPVVVRAGSLKPVSMAGMPEYVGLDIYGSGPMMQALADLQAFGTCMIQFNPEGGFRHVPFDEYQP